MLPPWRMSRPPRVRGVGSMKVEPSNPSIIQYRGPFSTAIVAPVSVATCVASICVQAASGQSLRPNVLYTSMCTWSPFSVASRISQ